MERVDAYSPDELRARGWSVTSVETPDPTPVEPIRLSIPDRVQSAKGGTIPKLIRMSPAVVKLDLTGLTKPITAYEVHLLRYTVVKHARKIKDEHGGLSDYYYTKKRGRIHPVNGASLTTPHVGNKPNILPAIEMFDGYHTVNRPVGDTQCWSEFGLVAPTADDPYYKLTHLNMVETNVLPYVSYSAIASFFARADVYKDSTEPVAVWRWNNNFSVRNGGYKRKMYVKPPNRYTFREKLKNLGFCLYDKEEQAYVSNDVAFSLKYALFYEMKSLPNPVQDIAYFFAVPWNYMQISEKE